MREGLVIVHEENEGLARRAGFKLIRNTNRDRDIEWNEYEVEINDKDFCKLQEYDDKFFWSLKKVE
tara:strand:+ start:784 stop:981 length:198 start_codon:yes stop_codon:yes gene_type:complete